MPKVKVFIVDDPYEDDARIREGVTDWEEISESDLVLLRSNLYRLDFGVGYGRTATVVVQDPVPVETHLVSIKEKLVKIKKEDEARLKQEEAQKTARAKKKAANAAAKEKAQYEKLKQKFGV